MIAQALAGNHPVVTYEVLLALQSLVAREPAELHEPAWDVILDTVRAVVDQDRECCAARGPRRTLLL